MIQCIAASKHDIMALHTLETLHSQHQVPKSFKRGFMLPPCAMAPRSCRLLLLLIAVVGIVLGLLRQPALQLAQEQKLAERIAQLGGSATWGGTLEGRGGQGRSYLGSIDLSGTQVTDADLAEIGKLPYLTHLALNDTQVSDSGMRHLAELPCLVQLEVCGTSVTDQGVRQIAQIQSLEVLKLDRCPITNEALDDIAQLSSLWMLYLNETAITGEGLLPLQKLSHLRTLSLEKTQVTDQDCDSLSNVPALEMVHVAGTQVSPERVNQSLQANSGPQLLP